MCAETTVVNSGAEKTCNLYGPLKFSSVCQQILLCTPEVESPYWDHERSSRVSIMIRSVLLQNGLVWSSLPGQILDDVFCCLPEAKHVCVQLHRRNLTLADFHCRSVLHDSAHGKSDLPFLASALFKRGGEGAWTDPLLIPEG
jgi:hypothetical protein